MGQEHSSSGNEIIVTYTKRTRSSTILKRTTPEILNVTIKNNKYHHQQYSTDSDREPLLGLSNDKHYVDNSNKIFIPTNFNDDMTCSDMSSSVGTREELLQDSYHSNSITGDSGVDCHEISMIKSYHYQQYLNNTTIKTIKNDDENRSLMNSSTNETTTILVHSEPRKYDSDTALSRSILFQDTRK